MCVTFYNVVCVYFPVPAMNDEVIKCMIPKEHVSDDIVDMCLVSILSKSKTQAHLKYSVVMLQWLLSKFKLIKVFIIKINIVTNCNGRFFNYSFYPFVCMQFYVE